MEEINRPESKFLCSCGELVKKQDQQCAKCISKVLNKFLNGDSFTETLTRPPKKTFFTLNDYQDPDIDIKTRINKEVQDWCETAGVYRMYNENVKTMRIQDFRAGIQAGMKLSK